MADDCVESCGKVEQRNLFGGQTSNNVTNIQKNFNKNLNKYRPFHKKDSLAQYLSYSTLVTYVPVMGAE